METPELPGYELVREIGSGGMATVYLAVQQNLHREVALKVMTPGLSVEEVYCHRFLKEGRIAAQLAHQNLLTVYDIGVHDDFYYMASEYLPGGTVRQAMSRGMDEASIVQAISDVAQGLDYAHAKGFVHRDVKPGNLLYRANGECVLGDFGIAKSVDSNTGATKLGTSIGTPHYMSPEQAKGAKVDHRSDLYSLGVVFYEVLTGKPPFDADDPFSVALMQINDQVPAIEGEYAKFNPLIARLMEKDREARYETADDFLIELEALTGLSSSSRRTTRRMVSAESKRQASQQTTAQSKSKPEPESKSKSEARPAKQSPSTAETPKPSSAATVVAPPPAGLEKATRSEKSSAAKPARTEVAKPAREARGGTRSTPWGKLIGIVLLLGAIAVGGWYYWTQWKPDVDPPTPVSVPDPVAAQLDALAAEARAFIESGALFEPERENASAIVGRMARLDEDSPLLETLNAEIVDAALDRAKSAWSDGRASDARRITVEARNRYPDVEELDALFEQIESNPLGGLNPRTTPPTGESGDVAALLGRADRYYQAAEYLEATATYKRILELQPDNELARQRLDVIANNWATAAERFLLRGDLDTASFMIEKGMQANPTNNRLAELSERLAAARNE